MRWKIVAVNMANTWLVKQSIQTECRPGRLLDKLLKRHN